MSSTNPENTAPFESALLLADQESSAAVDKVTLRSAGISRLRFSPSGLEVAAHLSDRAGKIILDETELIVCLPKLQDLTALQFVEIIRSHPLLPHIPLLALASDPAQVSTLKKAGFDGVLLRPFNTTTLCNTIHQIAEKAEKERNRLLERLRQTPGIPSSEVFEALLSTYAPIQPEALSPYDAYKYGVQLMRDFHWDTAFPFITKALEDRRTKGNANMALSAYWTINQDDLKTEECLKKAVASFLETHQWDRAADAAGRLMGRFPHVPNPLLPALEKRSRNNQHETVVALVQQAKKILSTDEDIVEAICQGAKNSLTPAKTLPTIIESLRSHDFAVLADLLSAKAGLTPKKSWTSFLSGKKTKAFEPAQAPEVPAPEKKTGVELRHETARPAFLDMPLSDELLEGMAARPPVPKEKTDSKYSGPVISPIGGDDSLQPSPLGDAWTVVQGTLRMARKKK